MLSFNVYFACLCACVFARKQNFLLIVVDDLRPALGCYGDAKAHTPNIDRLAATSAIFTQAYAQQALCAPSRNSFLTGRRPDTLQLYDFYSYWRDTVGNFTTLPQHLKNNGYVAKSVGKIFHPGASSNYTDDEPYSWTEKPFHPYTNIYKDARVCRDNWHSSPARNLVCPVKVSSMPNGTLPDIEISREAGQFLRARGKDGRPFFLAVGFQKPHIPLKYPEKYLKYHPSSKFDLPDPYAWPDNVSSVAYNPWTDLRKREDVEALRLRFPWERIPAPFARKIIRSYYAAVTYVDDLIGRLLNRLAIAGISKNTVVILTSDHGWSLGEHGEWAKYSNFDVAVRVPLLISVPGLTFRASPEHCTRVNQIAELVDIFPTVADLAGFPIPICPKEESEARDTCAEGISLVPLLRYTSNCQSTSWKRAAFGQYPRPSVKPTMHPNSDKPRLEDIRVMGYTLKTSRYRYTAWLSYEPKNKTADWSTVVAEELYDHDVDSAEKRNVASSSTYHAVKLNLEKLLRAGWRSALPNATTLPVDRHPFYP